jgi:hypothetical protein
MPPVEDLLRGELERVADNVQPGQLRPLRLPVPERRWHRRLLPVAAAAAVIAVAVAAVLVAGPKPVRPAAPGAAGIPRYYLTFTFVPDPHVHGLPVTEAVIRASATGKVTGTVKIVTRSFPAPVVVAAAPDGRSFILATQELAREGTRGQSEGYRFFRLPISAGGKPGHLTELPAYQLPTNAGLTGIALSPDGTFLAVSLSYGMGQLNGHAASVVAAVEVINVVTGTTRIWTAVPQHGHYYAVAAPSWADGDRMIAFTWAHSQSLTNDNSTMEGVRLLDTHAPGGNLADAPMIVSRTAVSGVIQSALITPDGRDVVVATARNVSSGGSRGTMIAQIVEVPTARGEPARVLRTESAGYNLTVQGDLRGQSQVLSLDPTGRYVLLQCVQFGWLDLDAGRFTPLPPYPSGRFLFVYGSW